MHAYDNYNVVAATDAATATAATRWRAEAWQGARGKWRLLQKLLWPGSFQCGHELYTHPCNHVFDAHTHTHALSRLQHEH